MFARKFLSHLEDHANQLSDGLTEKIARSGRCAGLLDRVPAKEQKQTMREIYRHMEEWLLNEKAVDQEYYISVGMRRAQQGVPFSELLSAVCAARQYFWEYVERETLLDEPADFWGGVRLLRSLDSFFDSVLCFAAIGYQKYNEAAAPTASAGVAKNVRGK
jgi:hypothetical protein